MGVLGISLLFLLIPSFFVGFSQVFGLNMFSLIGPFYIVGLLLTGTHPLSYNFIFTPRCVQ